MSPLSPALRCVWLMRSPGRRLPLIADDLLILIGQRHVPFAIRRSTWTPVWSRWNEKDNLDPWCVTDGDVLLSRVRPPGVERLVAATGEAKMLYPWDSAYGNAQVEGRSLVWGWLKGLHHGNLDTGRVSWSISTDLGPDRCGTGALVATPKIVVYGQRGGDIVAASQKAGREIWRVTIADLAWEPVVGVVQPGESRDMIHYRDTVIVAVGIHHLVCLDLTTGKRRWVREELARNILLVDDRLYVGPSTILDPKTGRVIGRGLKSAPAEWEKNGICIVGGLAVSATHGFAVTNTGAIVAWDWKKGEVVWSGRVAGARGGFDTKLLISDGRLYCSDSSNRLYCWEEVEATDPVLRADRDRARTEGRPAKLPTRPVEIKEPTARTPGGVEVAEGRRKTGQRGRA